jgi:chromosomal replication initiator protein
MKNIHRGKAKNERGTPQRLGHEAGDSLWQACMDQLAQELPEQQFNTWIKPLSAHRGARFLQPDRASSPTASSWTGCAPSTPARIGGMLEKLHGQPVQVELALAPRETPVKSVFPFLRSRKPVNGPGTHGNTALTFDTWSKARPTAWPAPPRCMWPGTPGQLYNPLFIYGGVGLGKTHLMHAVGNKLLADRPDAKVLYIHAEQFVSDVVKAYQRKTFDEFKDRYHSLDCC